MTTIDMYIIELVCNSLTLLLALGYKSLTENVIRYTRFRAFLFIKINIDMTTV